MDTERREILIRRWLENQHELVRLADLPVGEMDPCERERVLLEEQDNIGCVLALDNMRRQQADREDEW